ncbi:NepR family anti-sigma factor [Acetobacter orientalis]
MEKIMGTENNNKPLKTPDQAFDLWLKRGLHQLFDDVANEPIPEELLKLIEEDRKD